MANSDKNIRITTSKNKTTYPNIVFTGSAAGSSVITLEVLDDNTLSFTSNEGQVFSIDSNLSTGTIWAVSDISGIPLLSASAGGTVGLGVYGGLVAIGQTNPIYKLDLKGSFGLASSNDSLYNFIFNNSSASGSNSLQIRSANSLLLYNSGNTFYTGFKSNAATNITYTLPTTDGSSGQFLQTNGSAVLTWATATGSGGTGSTAGVGQGGQYEMAYYPGTGLSVIGSNTFTNNTVTGVVSITHSTVSTDSSTGAFKVTGGVGIGGSLYVGGIGASITGVTFSNSTITRGTWNGTAISTTYGGTGQNLGSSSGVLTISSGTVSASTTSSAILSAITDETGSGVLVFNTQPSFGTGVTTNSTTFAVFNTNATAINAFGAATTISIGAATGKATFNSTDNSISSTTGGLVVSGGAGFAKSISIAGYLQLLNGANVTAFVSSGTGNTVYTLPATSPATGSSVLQSTSAGVMSWVPLATGSGSVNSGTANFAAYYATSSTAISENANLQFTGTGLSVGGNLSSSSTLTGSLIVRGGLGITGNAFIGSTVTIQDTTVSSSTTTGALVVAGGIGVGGKVFADVFQSGGNTAVGGNLTVAGTVDLGNAITDTISFLGRVDTDIDPISNNTYDLGVPALAYRNASFGSSIYFTNSTNTNILAFTAGATGTTLTYLLPIDTPTAGQILAASVISGGTVTLSWEDDQTGAPAGGITSLNSQNGSSQSLATGTSGTDFAISSVTNTHTFNLPDAGSSARGVVSTGTQTFAGGKTFSSALSVTDATVSTSSSTGALKVTGGVGIGGSLFTGTGFSSSISGVILANNTISASTYNKLTLTTPATSATLTLADGSTLATSGANSLTLTTTAASNVTFPTAGTLLTSGATSPSFLTSLTTGSATFALLNTTATTVNAFGAATVMSLGAATGKATFNSTDDSSSTTTGALAVSGGAGFAKSVSVGGRLQMFNGANFTAFVSSATSNVIYTLPPTAPAGTGTSYLSASTTGVMAWVAAPTSGGSGSVNSGTATYAAFYATTTNAVSENANLQFTGTGVSIGGRINSTSITSGSFYVYGGVGITGNAFIGGTTTITNTTNSSSTTTGALVIAGGAGIASTLFVGGTVSSIGASIYGIIYTNNIQIGQGGNNINFLDASGATLGNFNTSNGWFRSAQTTSSTSTSTGALVSSGGLGIAGNAFIGGTFVHQSSASSVSTNSGSVTLAGGIGIAGNAFIGGTVVQQNSTSSVGTNSGAITVAGGVGIAGNAFIGGTTTITNTTASVSSDSGALVSRGGAAVGQTLSIGGSLNIFNAANYTGFRFAGSANTTYTLPPRTPTGTGTSYLSSSIDGIMAWVAAPTGGSATPGGTNLGDIQYKSGSSFAGNAAFNYDEDFSMLTISNFPASSVNSSISALKILGTSQSWSGSSLGSFLVMNAAVGFVGDLIHAQVNGVSRLQLSGDGYLRLGAVGTGFTLPILNGTSGQVLTANTNGVASWTTVSGGSSSGGTVYAGTANQIAFYGATGNTVGGSATFTNNTSTGVVEITHTTESTSTTSGALQVDGGAGIAKSLFVGTTLSVGATPGYIIPNNLASFVSTVNSYNQLVIQNKSNGTSASANLVVNNDVSSDAANYGEIGMNSSTFTGSGALNAPNAVYVAAHTAPLVLGTVTSHPIRFTVNNGATDTLFIDGAGTAISVFTNFDLRSQNKIRFFNTGNTFRTDLHAGANTVNYALALPTAPVGSGYSTILVDTSGQMYFAPVEGGMATTSATGSRVVLRNKMEHHVWMSAGYTPLAAGADSVIYLIPDSSEDGATKTTFQLKEFTIRVETPSAGSSRIQLERSSTDTGAFALAATGSSLIGGFGLTLSGAGIYVTTTNTFVAGTFVTSGNLLRLNWTLLNATHANFSVQFTLNEV